jgi:hypothetical protein
MRKVVLAKGIKLMNESGSDTPKEVLAKPDGNGKDLFYHGTIQRLFPRNNAGIVRTSSGREIPFSFPCLDLLGPVKKPQELREGLVVGYDMGWTSDGLKVTKIKTYRKGGDEVAVAAADHPPDD